MDISIIARSVSPCLALHPLNQASLILHLLAEPEVEVSKHGQSGNMDTIIKSGVGGHSYTISDGVANKQSCCFITFNNNNNHHPSDFVPPLTRSRCHD